MIKLMVTGIQVRVRDKGKSQWLGVRMGVRD